MRTDPVFTYTVIGCYVLHRLAMSHCNTLMAFKFHSSYGRVVLYRAFLLLLSEESTFLSENIRKYWKLYKPIRPVISGGSGWSEITPSRC